MNVCIVHGGHGKERIYLLQKKYHIYISESHYPSEKLARDISVGEKISTIIIQNDGMFAQSTGVTAWREKKDICCRKTRKSEMFKMFTLSKRGTRETEHKICQIYFRMKVETR